MIFDTAEDGSFSIDQTPVGSCSYQRESDSEFGRGWRGLGKAELVPGERIRLP